MSRLIFLAVIFSLSTFASAHMWLRTPLSRGGQNFAGSTTGPCAGKAPGTGATRTVFEAGSVATFAFRVNEHGPAPFQFAFSSVADDGKFTTILAKDIDNTVTAGADDFQGVFVEVTIPTTTCDQCSIQLSGMGQTTGSGKWFNCADIKIVPAGSLGIPTVSSISPSTGPTTGGTTITVTGLNFGTQQTSNLKCRFELSEVAATWVSSTSITCVSPPYNVNKEGSFEVTVNGETFSVSGKTFTYSGNSILPVITSVEPATGKPGTKITITGNHFYAPSMLCKFGSSFAEATVVSATSATCFVPTFFSDGDVSIEVNVDGSPYSSSGKVFTVDKNASENGSFTILPQLSLLLVALFFIVLA